MTTVAKALAVVALALTSYTAMSARAEPPPAAAPAAAAAPVVIDPKANFREKGRIGLIGAITEDGWKGGLAFEHEYFEAQVIGHASYQSHNDHDIRLAYKLGGRTALGALNYLAYGGEFQHHPGGRENGISVRRDYYIAPYLSLERYFAATPIMLVLWVDPVQYDHSVVTDSGHAKVTPVWHVFQTGGFGLAYLFF